MCAYLREKVTALMVVRKYVNDIRALHWHHPAYVCYSLWIP